MGVDYIRAIILLCRIHGAPMTFITSAFVSLIRAWHLMSVPTNVFHMRPANRQNS